MAKLEPTSYTPDDGGHTDWRERYQTQDQNLADEMNAALDRYQATGDIKGIIYRAPYADSYAVYRVTKLRPFTVQHVNVGDAWSLPAPHIRGLTAADVKATLNWELTWRREIAKKG